MTPKALSLSLCIDITQVNTSLGYHAIYGCPELEVSQGDTIISHYTQAPDALDPRAIGEAVFRLVINPTPPLRNLVLPDTRWAAFVPLFCR